MVERFSLQGSQEQEVLKRSSDVAGTIKRLQGEILSTLAQRAVSASQRKKDEEDVSDEELEKSEEELNEVMEALGLSWDDLREMGIEEITVETVKEGGERASDSRGGAVLDPTLEANMKEYYHLEPSRDARLFLLNLYDDELGEDLWCLEIFPAKEMYRQGIERLQDGECCAAYILFSFASLKGCEEAGPALLGTAEVIHVNDRAYGTHHFEEVKANVERAMRFARKVP